MINRRADQDSESVNPPEAPNRPSRWWQWLLLYPSLIIAVVGAVPTYLELLNSYNLDVPYGHSADAREQNRLWQDNFECSKKADFANSTKNKEAVEIGVAICESGDVLLRGKRPEWSQPNLRWVSWSDVAPNGSADNKAHALLELISSAEAKEPGLGMVAQAPTGSVICQRWVAAGQLLQRIATRNGCFDQLINTFNGWVLSTHPAPCIASC